jgi:hypothetical protein
LVGIAAPGIVTVRSDHSRSSGFFWRPGLIVTAEEALSEEGDVFVTLPDGESIAARLVGRDHTTDIALLRVDRSDLKPIRLESPPVPVGAIAIAVVLKMVRQPQRLAWCRAAPARGGPYVAAKSTLGSNLICACDRVPKAVLPLRRRRGRLACSVWTAPARPRDSVCYH